LFEIGHLYEGIDESVMAGGKFAAPHKAPEIGQENHLSQALPLARGRARRDHLSNDCHTRREGAA
jgi:hypothetical protein